MSDKKSRARLWAVAATAAALVGGLAAVPAAAAPTIDIDPAATGSIVVHKFEQPQLAQLEGNGLPTQLDTTDWIPLGDVRFTATRVPGIDLTTDAGWASATDLTVAGAAAAVNGLAPDADETTANAGADLGQATLDDLPLGLYYVAEHLTSAQLASGLTPSAPFLVTVPLTDPIATDTWLYDVHVYPKNNADAITKSVRDEDTIGILDPANANENRVVWTIDASIPEGGQSDAYRIVDDLDARLDYVAGDTTVALTGLAGSASQLVAADYTVAATEETTLIGSADVVAGHTRVTVTLTPSGLAKIWAAKQANNDAQVQLALATTSNAIGDGVIPNNAVLFPNQYQIDNNPGGIPSNEVETRLGSIEIVKTDMDDTLLLPGAEFAVFLDEAEAREGDLADAIDIPGRPAGTKVVTTDAQGEAVIPGLRLSNFVNGARVDATDADYRLYYLVEITAPVFAGQQYELLADPIVVDLVDAGATAGPFVYEAEVRNAPHNAGFALPLTGGTGATIFVLVGLGAVLVGALLLVRRRATSAA
jgi:fimbrial isopeptide formation D2 family protein/LPXTG-motif cell wall-anchored protein